MIRRSARPASTKQAVARAIAASAAVYAWGVRPRLLRWGATDDEVRRPYPGQRSRSGRHPRCDDGRHHRRPGRASVALARADGDRPRGLVQLGPPRQLRTSERRPASSRVAADPRRRPYGGQPGRQRVVGGRGARAEAFPRAAHVRRSSRAAVRSPRRAATSLHGLDLGIPARRVAGGPHPARGQRLLDAKAAVAPATAESRHAGAFALGHADETVREPQAPCRRSPTRQRTAEQSRGQRKRDEPS